MKWWQESKKSIITMLVIINYCIISSDGESMNEGLRGIRWGTRNKR